MKDRGVAFIKKDDKILMVQVYYGHYFWTLPGGGMEEGETPEETCIRELKEETGIDGEIVRPLTIIFNKNGSKEYVFLCKMKDENQRAVTGYDPEEGVTPEGIQSGVHKTEWKTFEELSRTDQDFLYRNGLMEI